jgi:xylulose-5-phosphate/fructose-6-phosphate phosphoketolase
MSEEVDPMEQLTSEASGPLSPENLRLINAWWRAANYLSVGQIYLMYLIHDTGI